MTRSKIFVPKALNNLKRKKINKNSKKNMREVNYQNKNLSQNHFIGNKLKMIAMLPSNNTLT